MRCDAVLVQQHQRARDAHVPQLQRAFGAARGHTHVLAATPPKAPPRGVPSAHARCRRRPRNRTAAHARCRRRQPARRAAREATRANTHFVAAETQSASAPPAVHVLARVGAGQAAAVTPCACTAPRGSRSAAATLRGVACGADAHSSPVAPVSQRGTQPSAAPASRSSQRRDARGGARRTTRRRARLSRTQPTCTLRRGAGRRRHARRYGGRRTRALVCLRGNVGADQLTRTQSHGSSRAGGTLFTPRSPSCSASAAQSRASRPLSSAPLQLSELSADAVRRRDGRGRAVRFLLGRRRRRPAVPGAGAVG